MIVQRPYRYRLMMFQKPAGPWRATLREVRFDAIEAGVGSVDPNSRHFFISVPAWFDRRDPCPEIDALVQRRRARREKRLVEVVDLGTPPARSWRTPGHPARRPPELIPRSAPSRNW